MLSGEVTETVCSNEVLLIKLPPDLARTILSGEEPVTIVFSSLFEAYATAKHGGVTMAAQFQVIPE